MDQQFEIGVETFGDVTEGDDGRLLPHAQVLRNVVAEARAAEAAGLDFFGVGEHHRDDYAVSAPEVVLGAIAAQTERIRLGSAVTVLSSDDPVRVFERFATLDALSNGRAEVILGRGSFIESFPLFGYDLQDYEVLFEEKLALFAELLKEKPVTWSGSTRSGLSGQVLYPPTESGRLGAWVGVGGSPESVVRAARHGLPLFLAIIGGNPLAFEPLTLLYQRSLEDFGHGPQRIGAHTHGLVADTDDEALEILWPHYRRTMDRLGAERGWPPASRMRFQASAGPDGSLLAGSPETVARKIVKVSRGLGLSRLDIKYSAGTLPHAPMVRSIELLGSKVKPLVLDMLAG
ncbi:LLM class flavin-dependent oxidoreductase [Arthrobacter halodurans]|uniref:LLM class flavin-dependent oxidoreductase n=1 Tax=Arthrobacter halodurans TaxID=516699 RepID=A0ABV4URN0_9MICC